MWFKQLNFYQIDTENLPSINIFESKLSHSQLSPLSGLSWFVEGFFPFTLFSENLVLSIENNYFLKLTKEEKILPRSVIKDELENKIIEIEKNESREISRKEKKELKDQITDEFLIKALSKKTHISAFLNIKSGLLLINQSSQVKTDHFVSKLRESLGSLQAKLPNTKKSPAHLMTSSLLSGEVGGNFKLDQFCEICDQSVNASSIKISYFNLLSDAILALCDGGSKQVKQLGLIWNDKISFVLCDNLSIKKIRYLEVIEEKDVHYEDGLSKEDELLATHYIMAETLTEMIMELVELLGGWEFN